MSKKNIAPATKLIPYEVVEWTNASILDDRHLTPSSLGAFDWWAGACVYKALAIGAPPRAVLGLLAEVGLTVWRADCEGDDEADQLREEIQAFLTGNKAAKNRDEFYRARGMISWMDAEGHGLGKVLDAALWLTMCEDETQTDEGVWNCAAAAARQIVALSSSRDAGYPRKSAERVARALVDAIERLVPED